MGPGESWPNPNAAPAVPGWLRNLLGEEFFYYPACVVLARNDVTDEFISKYAAGFSEAHILCIKSTSIADQSLDYIAKLPQLEYLQLDCPNLTPAGLRRLAPLKSLIGVTSCRDPSSAAFFVTLELSPG